jgi:hypothetical protein
MAMTEADRKEFKEIVAEGNKSLREWLEATLHPIQKNVDKHEIFVDKIPVIEQKLDNHLELHLNNNNNKKFNIEMWVIIGIYLLDKLQTYLGG